MAGRGTPKPLAELIEACLAPALKSQGFAAADIVVAWPEIVGPRLAGRCEPVKIQWPKRPRGASPDTPAEPGTLVLRVESAFGLEVQHMAPVLLERVNAYFGWRCLGRIALRQGPVGTGKKKPGTTRDLDPAALAEAREKVAGVADDELREALVRLGAGIISARPQGSR
jgi:hypothetical protein